jgi:hypothetical protein
MEGLLWIRTLSMWAVKMWYACLQSRVTCKPPWLLQSSFPCWIGHSLVCLRIDSNNRPGSHMLCSRLPSYLQFFPRLYLSDLIGTLCSCTSFGCFLWIIWCSTHFLALMRMPRYTVANQPDLTEFFSCPVLWMIKHVKPFG